MREEGRITRLRRGVICSECAARKEGAAGTNPSCPKDERKWGFISIRFFRNKASSKVSFSSGDEGVILCYRFFKVSRLPLHPKKMRDERLLRCHKLLPSGAKRHLSKSCRYRNRKSNFAIIGVQFFVGKAVSSRIFRRAVNSFFAYNFSGRGEQGENQTTT